MRIRDWLRASRAPFFADVILCVCLGAAAALYETRAFDAWLLAACVLGVILLNAGTNLANDYYDHTSGADEVNPHPTPFSGGSRVIQDGTVGPKSMRNAAFACFALAVCVGAVLLWRCGWPVLAFGAAGALSGLFYTAPPLRLGYRGFGELLAGLNVGPVAVLGSYYVQTGRVSWSAVLASVPVGLLSSALLVINEIPDVVPDRAAGKMHLVARLGVDRAPWGYLALVVAAYASVAVAILNGFAPRTAALVFLSAPIGLLAFTIARRHKDSPRRIVPALGANVACLLSSGALLCTGYFLGAGMIG